MESEPKSRPTFFLFSLFFLFSSFPLLPSAFAPPYSGWTNRANTGLRETKGTHVKSKGSVNSSDALLFFFSFFFPPSCKLPRLLGMGKSLEPPKKNNTFSSKGESGGQGGKGKGGKPKTKKKKSQEK